MLLDMPTVSLVSISVTAILGFVLVFAWWQVRTSALAGWWGLAQLIMSLGIIIAVAGLRTSNNDLHAFGQACVILSGRHHVDCRALVREAPRESAVGLRGAGYLHARRSWRLPRRL